MKSFDEFLGTLSEDDYAEIMDFADDLKEHVRSSTEDPKYLLGHQVASMDLAITMAVLSKYHSWLSEQL